MATMVEFLQSASEDLLEQGTKQLLKIAQHYKVEVDTMQSKGSLRSLLCGSLQEHGLFGEDGGKSGISVVIAGLSFDQQKELLMLILNHERGLEEIKLKKEQMKVEVELYDMS